MAPGEEGFNRENVAQNIGQKQESNQATYRATKSSIIMNAIAVGILILTIIVVFLFRRRGYKRISN